MLIMTDLIEFRFIHISFIDIACLKHVYSILNLIFLEINKYIHHIN